LFIALLMLGASAASADTLTISGLHNADLGELEGFGGALTWAVTNTGTQNVTIRGLGFTLTGPVFPDAMDDATFMFTTPEPGLSCAIGMALAPGDDCILNLAFTTPKTTGEVEDLDQGLNDVRVLVGASDGSSAIGTGFVIVVDFPQPAPEPFALGLAASGLGVILVKRRRRCAIMLV
jgi:hypothetical protein